MPQMLGMMGAQQVGQGIVAPFKAYGDATKAPDIGGAPQQAATQPGQMGQESPMAMLMKMLQQRQQNQIVPGSTRGYETGAANNMFGG